MGERIRFRTSAEPCWDASVETAVFCETGAPARMVDLGVGPRLYRDRDWYGIAWRGLRAVPLECGAYTWGRWEDGDDG